MVILNISDETYHHRADPVTSIATSRYSLKGAPRLDRLFGTKVTPELKML